MLDLTASDLADVVGRSKFNTGQHDKEEMDQFDVTDLCEDHDVAEPIVFSVPIQYSEITAKESE